LYSAGNNLPGSAGRLAGKGDLPASRSEAKDGLPDIVYEGGAEFGREKGRQWQQQ